MKKYLFIALAALVALAACKKDPVVEEFANKNDGAVLTFTSKKPQLTPETKTAWNAESRSIVWTAGDKIRVGYTLDGTWMSKNGAADFESESKEPARFYASEGVIIDSDDAGLGTFSVPEGGTDNFSFVRGGKAVFYTVYPSTALSGAAAYNAPSLTVMLPTGQALKADTFDPSADIMVGNSAEITLTDAFPVDPIELDWNRIVAHADLTFTGLKDEGDETVSKITLTFNDEAKVAGSFYVDVTTGNVTPNNDSKNIIVLEGTNLSINSHIVEVWASLMPVTFRSLNVTIQTSEAIYSRNITGISMTFKQNSRNKLTIDMTSADKTELKPDEYTEYTGDLVEGDYIVYYNGNALKAAVSSNRMQNEAVTLTDGVIATNNASIIWHIAPAATDGYYTFYNAETGQYLAATNSKNQAQLQTSGTDDRSLFSVEVTDGEYEFINKARAASSSDPNNKYLRNNGANGWAMYAVATGGSLTLYSKDTRTALASPASVSAAINSSDDSVIDVTFSTVSGAASYIIIATPESGEPVEKSGVSASPTSVSVEDGLDYSTTYTISVVAVPSNTTTYKNSAPTSASGTVTTGVAPENPEGYELISTLNELETGSYIIAGKTGTQYYALPSISTGKIAGSTVSVSNDFIAAADGDSYVVTITKNAQGQVAIGDGTNYLVIKTSGTDFGTSTSATYHTVAVTNGVFAISNTRYLAWRGGGYLQFGNYANISGEYSGVYLFKYNRVPKANPETTVKPASPIALVVEGTQQLSVNTNSDGAVSYESDNNEVATVSNSGLITAVAAGTAHITVKTAATETYNAGSTVVTVNVTSGGGGSGATITDITTVTWSKTDAQADNITGTIGNYVITISNGYIDTTNKLIRVYSGKTITIASTSGTISGITFGNFNKGSVSNLSVSVGDGSYSNGSWTGSATSVTFSADTQIRFGSLTIN